MGVPSDPSGVGRIILGRTANMGLTLFTNSDVTNGSFMHMHGSLVPSGGGENRRGSIYYSAYYDADASDVGYRFLTFNNTNPASAYFQTNMVIGNDGRTMIGAGADYSFMAPGDYLTVRDQIGLFPSWTSADNVRVNGHTTHGVLALNANTMDSDGASIHLGGGAIGAAIQYISSNTGATDGHQFMNYETGTGLHNNAIIGNDGRMIIGKDASLSFAAPGDVLTVNDAIGLFPTVSAYPKVNGNTTKGGLQLNCDRDYTKASSIGLFSNGDALKGRIRYISFNPERRNIIGHEFLSYDDDHLSDNAIISNDGRMVIGKDVNFSYAAPGDVLTVRDQIGLFPSWTSAGVTKINGNTADGAFMLHCNTSPTDGASIGMYGSPGGGIIKYTAHDYGGGNGAGHQFMSYYDSDFRTNMMIYNDGKVAIGKNIISYLSPDPIRPDGYLLYVEKGILTEKLRVANHEDVMNWADFVFDDSYKLMPLHKVESFIKANKHLPDIPTAKDVANTGIDVAEMDAKLLQKIEELTLYVIDQQKEIEALKKNMSK